MVAEVPIFPSYSSSTWKYTLLILAIQAILNACITVPPGTDVGPTIDVIMAIVVFVIGGERQGVQIGPGMYCNIFQEVKQKRSDILG